MHNLIAYLENTCKTYGAKIAVDAADGALTFDQLRCAALQVAASVGALLRKPDAESPFACAEKRRIAVYLPKGSRCLCAMLGVLYGGDAYAPMDTRAPINRTKLMLQTMDPQLILTDAAGKQLLSENGVPTEQLADYDALLSQGMAIPSGLITATLARTQDADPAFLLFTSGSTGVPKGVVIPHRRVINYIEWARAYFGLGSDEVIGNQAPFYFTVSVMDIFLCLSTGSTLCIVPEDRFSRPEKLLRFLNEKQITLIFWVSSVYHNVAKADALATLQPQHLRRAWFVGEPMPAPSLSYWVERLPEVAFSNLYGSTETDMSICYDVPKGAPISVVPLGRPCANTEILLIKDDQTAAPPGEIGEICVRGACLALGYYQNPERTAVAFVQNPLHDRYPDPIYRTGDLGEFRDGLIYFHGRRDHQFKHLGYRIEAGEIEAIASKHAAIKSACVLYDGEKRQIVLFFEADGEIDEMAYRQSLMQDLPIYMVPTRFVRLEAMPYNANRKKDRVLLKATYMNNEER